MEFVTSGTCVKYSWALVNFSRIDAKNTLPLKFQARFFTKLTGVTTKPLILYVEKTPSVPAQTVLRRHYPIRARRLKSGQGQAILKD